MLSQPEINELIDLVRGFTPEQSQSDSGRQLTRRLVRNSLEAWARFVLRHKDERPAAHHRLILSVLQRITAQPLRADGRPHKIILLMPPGAAKSTYTSVCFPPWYLNINPKHLVLACSYSYTLIEDFGRQCRDLVEVNGEVLGMALSKSVAASGDWRNTEGGGYFCAGVGAGIAGHRADVAFIDDYLGNEQDADSQRTRDNVYNWYRKDFVPRLKPHASRIIIANRRHEDDLVGRLLAKESGEWEVISLPMLAEDNDPLGRKRGERLWPEWFTEEQVREARLDSRTWAGLYQQRPAPEEGNYFRKDTIVRYRVQELPSDLRVYVGSDFAVRRGEDSDRFCFLPAGVDTNGRLWILPDWYWVRTDTGTAVEEMLSLAKRRSPICWWAGRENITGAIAPFLYKRMQETNTYISIEELSESKDKEAKAQSIKARMAAKMVMFPDVPGMDEAEHELLTFPGGLHDDFVDALAKLGQGLAKMTPAQVTPSNKSLDEILNPRLTCGWVARSSKRAARRQLFERSDA